MSAAFRKIEQSELTPWFNRGVNPVHAGEYNASVQQMSDVLRWWDGAQWSEGYSADNTAASIRRTRGIASAWHRKIYWRGLAVKP